MTLNNEQKTVTRILICGSRKYQDKAKIKKFVESLPEGSILIEGEAKGADSLARECAEECGFSEDRILKFPADWLRFGKSAGPVRNRTMLVQGKPNVVAAFSDDLENSRGTKNMVMIARKAGVKVLINPVSWDETGNLEKGIFPD